MHDRADLWVLGVDHPMFDGIHGHPARPDVQRHTEEHNVPVPIEPLDHQDVAADLRHVALVHPTRAHPEAPGVFARAEVPI